MPSLRVRSALFCPGGDERKLSRALHSDASLVIADLEDAVRESDKGAARERLAHNLAAVPGAASRLAIRVNALNSPHAPHDLELVAEADVAALVVPKASADTLEALDTRRLPPVIAIVETPRGLQESAQIAETPGVFALMLGNIDLSRSLRLEARPDGLDLLHARSRLVIDSAAAGLHGPIDGAWTRLDDVEGLRAEAELARSLGLAGKACVHPGQVSAMNAVFRPSQAQVDWASRVVAAYDDAASHGTGVIRVDDRMVDAPVVDHARDILVEAQS